MMTPYLHAGETAAPTPPAQLPGEVPEGPGETLSL